ncbi:hypothetical protein I2483_13620 [Sporosarcina sp. E16_3]|uniref:hypothetical protein n=1 Tax=Sporosarcina sp. E16_3 TaxID=2789293 RepID=UPI001A91ED72|nr:hypothetical protein [Sporosarcina sp. E16_3]MBO0602701.1 hypothetical protein [Sporosarcina sp. E16_3]
MLNVRIDGLDAVMKRFTLAGIKAQGTADKVTETYTRKMANEAAALAPVDSGDMRANIVASPHRLAPATWEFGGTLPYTRRQEYEHATHKGFIRKSVWDNREGYREAMRREVTDV